MTISHGGIVGIPEGTVITATDASGTISSGTINVGGWATFSPTVSGSYTAFYPASTANMVAKKELSSDEIAVLIEQITTVFPENETLLMVMDAAYDDHQLGFLQNAIDARAGNRKVIVIPEPKKMALIGDRDATTEQEKIDLLARIGVIWENNPGLTLAMIISVMMGAPRVECGDEAIVSTLELAWG